MSSHRRSWCQRAHTVSCFGTTPKAIFLAVGLFVDDELVGEGDIERVPLGRYNLTGGRLTCGWEQGPAVGDDYRAPFRFTGRLESVVIAVEGAVERNPAAEFDAIMAEQ